MRIGTFISFFIFFSSSLNTKAQLSSSDSIFHPDSIRRIVEILASDSLKGRYTGTLENYKAAEFIAGEFENAGLKPVAGNNGFFQQMKPAWENVIGAINGRSKAGQVIIFCSHYDHIGTISSNPYQISSINNKRDTIFNGAMIMLQVLLLSFAWLNIFQHSVIMKEHYYLWLLPEKN